VEYKRGDIIIAKSDFHHMKRHDILTVTDVNSYYGYINTNIGITMSLKKFHTYFYTETDIQRKEKLKNLNNYEI
jgi:hypothetical protein